MSKNLVPEYKKSPEIMVFGKLRENFDEISAETRNIGIEDEI